MRRPHLTYANVVSSLALFLALGGTSWALTRNSVGNRELKRDAVTSAKVKDRSLTAADLADGALRRGPRGAEGAPGAPGAIGATGPPGIAPAPESWHGLPLRAGWFPYGEGHRTPTFRKDVLGVVQVRGLVTHPAGALTTSDTIATLPLGYRPSEHDLFSVTDGGIGHLRLDVFPDGQIVLIGSGGPTVGLSGIAFATD